MNDLRFKFCPRCGKLSEGYVCEECGLDFKPFIDNSDKYIWGPAKEKKDITWLYILLGLLCIVLFPLVGLFIIFIILVIISVLFLPVYLVFLLLMLIF